MHNENGNYLKNEKLNKTENTFQEQNDNWNYCQAWTETVIMSSPCALPKLII